MKYLSAVYYQPFMIIVYFVSVLPFVSVQYV